MSHLLLNALSIHQLADLVPGAGPDARTWHYSGLKWLDVHPGEHILAFGCGTGLRLSLCLACGAAKVTGFAPSLLKLMIAYRRNRAAYFLSRFRLRHGGPETLQGNDTPVTKVLYTHMTDCSNDRARVLLSVASAVAPGGRIVVTMQPAATTEIASAVGENFRLALIDDGWIGTRVDDLPLRRGYSVCVSGRRELSGRA